VTAATIVAMTPAHIDELMAYEREMFDTEAWTASSYRSELADTHSRHYVAAVAADNTLVGWAGVRVVGQSADILTVGVIPSARRRGIGRLLVDDLVAEARRRGATEAFLEVRADNNAAQALYTAQGWAEIGRRRGYYAFGRVDAVVMRVGL